jgi:hypothetical protein
LTLTKYLAPHALSENPASLVTGPDRAPLLVGVVMGVHKLTAGDGYTYVEKDRSTPDVTHLLQRFAGGARRTLRTD